MVRGVGIWLLGLAVMFGLQSGLGGALASDDMPQPAASPQIAVELRDMRVEQAGEAYRFVHDRAFIESAGVGVTLTQGQVCFSSGICNGKAVEYRIEPNGTYVIEDAVLQPLTPDEQFAFTYQGEDDNGRPVIVFFRVTVKGDTYEVSP